MEIKLPIPKLNVFTLEESIKKLSRKIGIYCFYGKDDELLYVGKSIDIGSRIYSHVSNEDIWKVEPINKVKSFSLDCEADMDIYETYLINLWKPKLNKRKVFTYKPKTNKFDIEVPICKDNEQIKPEILADVIFNAIALSDKKKLHRQGLTSLLKRHGYFPYPSIGTEEYKKCLDEQNINYEKGYFFLKE